ncbi:endonuclease/exonuclease/phosphatase family protein [Pseudomonas sp. NPDC089428]|uniref:endonuclease/exonuclease/phosphatase family protein n=1 Tax=unclassified Pseudomonas TaxID=196821 RepID=UPI0031D57900
MPVSRRIRLDADYFLTPSVSRTALYFHLSAFIDDIFDLLATDPTTAEHSAAFLSYHLSTLFVRNRDFERQMELAEDLATLLDVHYNEPTTLATLSAAPRAQAYAVLLRFYNIHHAVLSNGLRATEGPLRLDAFAALRLLRSVVGAAWGPWQALVRLSGAIRDYYHIRVVNPPGGSLIEVGRQTFQGFGVDIRVASFNLQGLNAQGNNKYQSHILPMLAQHDIVAVQEAGDAPPSSQLVAQLTVTDQFGAQHLVNQYIWQAGTLARPLNYYLYVLDVNRLRVRLAMVVTEQVQVDEVVVIADGVPRMAGLQTARPVLGLRVRLGGMTEAVAILNFHAISNGGANCSRVLREVTWHVGARYALVGDFNRDPRPPNRAFPRRGNWVNPPGIGEVVMAQGPTHPSFGPTQMLDYAVTNGTREPSELGRVGPVMDSDHRSVSYTFSFSG